MSGTPQVLTVNHRDGTGTVFGMHEGDGPVSWKRLATGGNLDLSIQGWDYATLPPGSTIGEHDHESAGEIWLILGGEGDVTVDGEIHRMVGGHVLYTPTGRSHAVTVPSSAHRGLEFLVVTLARLAERSAQADSEVHTLDGGPVELNDPTGAFRVSSFDLGPGERRLFDDGDGQALLYVSDGAGTASWVGREIELRAGSVLAIPDRQRVEISSTGESLTCLSVEIAMSDQE